MRVRVIQAPVVDGKHGITVGRVFTVKRKHPKGVWVSGDAGEDVLLFWRRGLREYEVVLEKSAPPPSTDKPADRL